MCLAIPENPLPGELETSGHRAYSKNWHTSSHVWVSVVSMIFCVLKFVPIFGSLRTSLLCIMGELAGGGFVAVAVGVSDI